MITIDLNFQLKDISGEIIQEKEANAGRILGNKLAGSSNVDYLKYYDWGRKLHKGDPIQVDQSDFEAIKDFVKAHRELTALGKAQIMEYLTPLRES